MNSPASLLRIMRQRAGLTQSELARRAGTSQPTLARYESGELVPRFETLTRLAAAAEHTMVVTMQPEIRRGALTIDEVASDLRSLIDSDGVAALWRRLLDFVDDFRGSSHAGKVWLIEVPPQLIGDQRVDAAIAGIVEMLCSEASISVPLWANQLERFVAPWWFVNDLPGFEAMALRDTPFTLARHGVFVNEGAFSRA